MSTQSTQQDVVDALQWVAGAAQAVAPVLPGPGPAIARIIGAAAGAASVALDAGKSEAEVVASIHRIRAIDTSAQDAEVDARVAAKPSRAGVIPPTATAEDVRTLYTLARRLDPDESGAAIRAAAILDSLVRDRELKTQ